MVMKSKTFASRKVAGAFAKNVRKLTTKSAGVVEQTKLTKIAKNAPKDEEHAEESEVESNTGQIMKRPAAANNCEDVDVANAQIVAVEKNEPTETEINQERTKELRAMSAADLKEMVVSLGLETGTKEIMVGRVLKHEAKLRKEALLQKSKIRAVVSQKKQELEELPLPELTKLCNDAGFKGLRSKPEKVMRLLIHWQENDGVDRAFASLAIQERTEQLSGMEDEQLRKLCSKYGFDAHVKEIMVDRINRKEHEMGLYLRPCVKELAQQTSDCTQLDVVEALLASEARRKKEHDLRIKREEALESKRKAYKATSLDELKKLIAKKKLSSIEKKDDMITALMLASVQEDLAAARKLELQSKPAQELIDLLVLNGLDGTGGKDKMIKRFLDHEAKINDDLKVFEGHVDDIAKQKHAELEKKTNAQLKEMCEGQGLALGGGKEERVERLIQEERKSGSFDTAVSIDLRAKRWDALMRMPKAEVLEICAELDVNPLMKEAMVERIMAHEKEHPSVEQPRGKKARVSK